MRLTAPELSARYRDGMLGEGANVLDAGQVGTEMLYFLVGSRELDGGLMCTASHNPKAYTGAKLVARGRARAVRRQRHPGHPRDDRGRGLRRPPGAAARGSLQEVDVYGEFQAAALSFVDADALRARAPAEGRRRRRQRDGRPDGRPAAGAPGSRADRDLLDARRQLPRPRAQPAAAREPPRDHRAGRASEADLGIAWDGDGDRCFFIDDSGAFVDGDFMTALLARVAAAQPPGRGDPVRRARLASGRRHRPRRRAASPSSTASATPSSRRRMRDEGSLFGGEVSGHYYFRDFYCADSGTMPALLMLEMLSADSASLSELLRALPLALLHLRRDQLGGRRPARQDGARSQRTTPTPARIAWTASRSTTTTGTSTCAPRTPSRCCACAWSRCLPRTWNAAATRCSR